MSENTLLKLKIDSTAHSDTQALQNILINLLITTQIPILEDTPRGRVGGPLGRRQATRKTILRTLTTGGDGDFEVQIRSTPELHLGYTCATPELHLGYT